MTHACKSNIEEGAVILVLRSLWTDVPLKNLYKNLYYFLLSKPIREKKWEDVPTTPRLV